MLARYKSDNQYSAQERVTAGIDGQLTTSLRLKGEGSMIYIYLPSTYTIYRVVLTNSLTTKNAHPVHELDLSTSNDNTYKARDGDFNSLLLITPDTSLEFTFQGHFHVSSVLLVTENEVYFKDRTIGIEVLIKSGNFEQTCGTVTILPTPSTITYHTGTEINIEHAYAKSAYGEDYVPSKSIDRDDTTFYNSGTTGIPWINKSGAPCFLTKLGG
eukprot:sb/3470067/